MAKKTVIEQSVKAQILSEYFKGAEQFELAKQFNVGRDVVRRVVHKAKAARPQKQVSLANEQLIVAKYNEGLRYKEIAESVGFHYSTVERIINKYGIANRSGLLDETTKLAIIHDYQNGVGSNELCKKYDTNSCTIFRLTKAAGITKQRKDINEQTKRLLIQDYQQGLSIQQAAKKFKLAPGTVSRILVRANKRRPLSNTPAETRLAVVEAYASGITSSEVAKQFGISTSSVSKFARAAKEYLTCPDRVSRILSRLNGKQPLADIPAETRHAIAVAYAKGETGLEVAKRFGVSANTVLKFAKLANIRAKKSHSGTINQHKDIIIDLYSQGHTLEEVAKEVGFSLTTVYKLLLREEVQIRSISETVPKLEPGQWVKLREALRLIPQYRAWHKAVAERDKKTCQHCGAKGKKARLEVDHIRPFSAILAEENIQTIEEGIACKALWDVDNGRVLCHDCHKETPTYGLKTKRRRKSPLVQMPLFTAEKEFAGTSVVIARSEPLY